MPTRKKEKKQQLEDQQQRKSKRKNLMKERKEKVLSSLREMGSDVYGQLLKNDFPSVKMPSRSIANILYDDKTRQYILTKRSVKRRARHHRHIRRITQV